MTEPLHPAIEWCHRQLSLYQRQIELMETNRLRTHEDRGGALVDTTAESLATARRLVDELEHLLEAHGAP